MISVNLIERFFQGRRFEQLLENLTANGLEAPLPLRIRLAQVPAATVALGLRRLLELTYGPTVLSREMTSFLLTAQEPDGSFGQDPLATSAAAAALAKLLNEPTHALPTDLENQVSEARGRALAALSAMQGEDGLFRAGADRTEQDRALSGAFILLLLVRDDAFRQAVRSAELIDWFEQHGDHLEAQTGRLWAMACLGSLAPSPAVAA